MIRSLLTFSVIAALAMPAGAASYSAKLTSPTTQRIIARDITWQCGADACQGATAESRPVVLCQSLAKKTGKVASFLVDGRAFTDAELAKCNASAKATTSTALAAQ
jgi:hypothetical protein